MDFSQLDYPKFFEKMCSNILQFLEKKPSADWINENVCKQITKYPLSTSIPLLIESVVNEWIFFYRSVPLPKRSDAVLCTILEVTHVSLRVSRYLSDVSFDVFIHDSLRPFVDSVLSPGRKITLFATDFFGPTMMFPRAVVVEFEQVSDFALNEQCEYSGHITEISEKKAILSNGTELELSFGFEFIFSAGDFIFLYQPYRISDAQLKIGDKTVTFRVRKEYSLIGIVQSIKHNFIDFTWTNTEITVHSFRNEVHAIFMRKNNPDIKENHVVYFFHLQNIDLPNEFSCSAQTAIYDLSILSWFYCSCIVRPLLFNHFYKCSSAVIVGMISSYSSEDKQVHTVCGCVLDRQSGCLFCNLQNPPFRMQRIVKINVEDGFGRSLTLFSSLKSFPLLKNSFGTEFVFGISRGNKFEICANSSFLRIDFIFPYSYERVKHLNHLIHSFSGSDSSTPYGKTIYTFV
jgi:hypothetical protein